MVFIGMSNSEIILYHVPPSFYSQVARLVLAEANVRYESRYAIAGPPLFETYEPWYLKLNPNGTVPTLVIGGEAVDDSRKILHEVDARFASGRLTPNDESQCALMNRWLDKAYALPERVFAYGSDRLRSIGARVNRGRRAALLERMEAHPNFAAVYKAKMADIDLFVAQASGDEMLARLHQERVQVFDELEAQLAGSSFIVNDAYTLADVMWTVTISRQLMLGADPLAGRPNLLAWYHRMKARPSFAQADVWERIKPHKMLPVVYDKFPIVIYGSLLVAFALVGVCAYAFF